MQWSFPLFSFRSIGVKVHITFFLLLVWVAFVETSRGAPAAVIAQSVVFILALFACVVLHEFGHALTAARYGIRTRDITLLPIGGLARLERMPDDPRQELVVAAAGPAVNVGIAALIFLILSVTTGFRAPDTETLVRGSFLMRLLTVNIALVLFNLLPAFPMDGGRILRAVLALRMSYAQATSLAATVGQGMALVIGFLGFIGNPFLVLIAVFVWIGAGQESHMAQMRTFFSGTMVREATVTEFHSLSPQDLLRDATRLLLAGSQLDFPVVNDGHLVGMLTREGLTKALGELGSDAAVEQAMEIGRASCRERV
jgi:Zn-dependent protease